MAGGETAALPPTAEDEPGKCGIGAGNPFSTLPLFSEGAALAPAAASGMDMQMVQHTEPKYPIMVPALLAEGAAGHEPCSLGVTTGMAATRAVASAAGSGAEAGIHSRGSELTEP
eukprot:9937195-Prorocentrum_lima.AAC.1